MTFVRTPPGAPTAVMECGTERALAVTESVIGGGLAEHSGGFAVTEEEGGVCLWFTPELLRRLIADSLIAETEVILL